MTNHVTKKQFFGIFCLVIGQLFFTINFNIVKYLTPYYTVFQLMMFRFMVGPFVLAPRVVKPGFWPKKRTYLLVIRTLFGFCAMTCLFLGFKYGDPGQVTLLFYCSIIWATVAAYFILNELPQKQTMLGLVLALLGLFLILRPDQSGISLGSIYAMLGSLFNVGVILTLKKCRQYFDAELIVLVFCVISFCISVPLAKINTLGVGSLKWMALIGAVSMCAQFFFTKGYKYCIASVSSSMGVVSIPLMYISGFFFFNEHIAMSGVAGILIVMVSIVLIARYQ